MRPHRRQPSRLPRPWDSPGKNTGVGCHFLLQCMKVKSESEVTRCVQPSATPWTAAHQALLSMGLARQEYWSGVPLPSPAYILLNGKRLNALPLKSRTRKNASPHHFYSKVLASVTCQENQTKGIWTAEKEVKLPLFDLIVKNQIHNCKYFPK